METRIQSATRKNLILAFAAMAGLMLVSGALLADESGRVSMTTQMSRADRDLGLPGKTRTLRLLEIQHQTGTMEHWDTSQPIAIQDRVY